MHYGSVTIFLIKEIIMKKLVLIAIAVGSLVMVSCGGDGCTVGDTKCSNGNVMVCDLTEADSLSDWDDGTWEVNQECEDGETCIYDSEYDAHWCE